MDDRFRAFLGNLVAYSERKGADMSMVPQEIRQAATWEGSASPQEWTPDEQYDPSGSVSISINPETMGVEVQAPQYFLDSPEYQQDILPALQRFEGMELPNVEASPIFTPEFQQQIQDQSDIVRERSEMINQYIRNNDDATPEDAMVYYRNSTAGLEADDDDDTQVTLPNVGGQGLGSVRAPGTTGSNVSVKEFMDSMRDRPDMFRLNYYNRMNAIARDSNENPTNRAAAQGVINFMQAKGLLNASGDTQSRVATQEWINTLRGTLPGAIGGALAERSIGSDAYREQVEATDQLRQLEGAEAQAQAQAIPRMAVGLGLDLASAGGLLNAGRAAVGAVGRAAATGALGAGGTRIASGGIRAGQAINRLGQGGMVGRTAATTIRDTPFNVAFGVQEALSNVVNDEDQSNILGNFATDTLLSAGMFGLAGAAGRAIRAVDSSANPTINRASRAIGKNFQRLGNIASKVPGVKSFTTNFVNRNSPLIRQVRKAKTSGKITAEDEINFMNNLSLMNRRGAGAAADVQRYSPEYQAAAATQQMMTPDELRLANEYNNTYQTLVHAERGGYGEVTPEKLDQLRNELTEVEQRMDAAIAASGGRFDPRGYRQQLIAYNERINQFARERGLTDAEFTRLLQENGALTGDYTAMQRQVDRAQEYFAGRSNNLNTARPVRQLRGLSDAEAVDPLLAANERLAALSEIAARNEVDSFIARGIEEGWVKGRILEAPEQVGRRATLQVETRNRRDRIFPRMEQAIREMSDEMPRLVDEIVNAGGDADIAARYFDDTIRQKIDEVADDLVNDEVIGRQIREYTEGTDIPPRQVAYEMLDSARSNFDEMVERSFGGTKMDAAEQADMKEAIKQAISEETQKAIVQSGSVAGVNDIFQELKALNKEMAGVRSDSANAQAFFRNGQKGYFEVADPDLIQYYSRASSPGERGMIQRALEGTARAFRYATTALEPAFAYVVSPIRDSIQSMVLSGTGVFDPRTTRQTMVDVAAQGDQAKADQWMRGFDQVVTSGAFNDLMRNTEDAARANHRARRLAGVRGAVRDQVLNVKNMATNPMQYLRKPEQIVRQVEDIMSIPEIKMRERVYVTRLQDAKARGLSDDAAQAEASYYAINAMTDFSNVGEKIERIARTIPYLNAGIQGLASFNRVAMLDPIGVAMRLTSGIVTPSAYLMAYNMADENRRNAYFNTPAYEREMNFIIALDDGSVVKIPMSHELAGLMNPVREFFEAQAGLGDFDFIGSAARGFGISSPLDYTGFLPSTRPGEEGEIDLGRGFERMVGGLLPQAATPFIEAGTGRNMFTGNPLNPTEEDVIARGGVAPGKEVTGADLTFANNDSQALRNISDFIRSVTGGNVDIAQGTLQNVVRNFGGTLGQTLLSTTDRIIGAPEERQGGRSFGELFSRRLFNKEPKQVESDFANGLRDLEQEREQLLTRLDRLGRDNYEDRDNPDATSQNETLRQSLIEDYGRRVNQFGEDFGNYYERVGGLSDGHKRRLMSLMNLSRDNRQIYDPGTPERAEAQSQFFEGRDAANRLGVQSGLQPYDDRRLFGRVRRGFGGEGIEEDMSNTTYISQMIRDQIYGAPRQAVAEFNELMKGNRLEGIYSMKDVKDRFQKAISAIYDRGTLSSADFDEIEALQNQYMEQFDARVMPLFEKYGTAILNNNDVVNELRGLVMIPRSEWAEGTRTSRSGRQYQQFISSKVFPNAGPDVKKILQQRYNISDAATQGLRSDEEVRDRIESINQRMNSGRRASALDEARRLQARIQSGNLYADEFDISNLRNILGGN